MATSTLQFDPKNFQSGEPIDNNASNYLQFTPGTVFNYEIKDASETVIEVRTVTVSPDQTKSIQIGGATINCIVVIDEVRDAATNALIEVAHDYFAQDKFGNVW